LPTEVAEQFMHYVERALQIGDIQIFEYQLLVGGNMRDHEARMVVSGEDEVLVIVRDITGRRRAEVVLRESEEHFRSLIENALDIITILNGDGTIRYESPSIERVLGYKPEDLIGKNVFEFIQPDDALNVINTFTHGIQNPGVATSAELRFQHKDGSWRILEAIGTSFLDDSGVTGIVVNSRDITERKRAEEALRESEERFRTLFENIPTGVYRTTPDGRILNANPALIKMLGYASFEELALRNLEKEGFESRYSRRKFRERIERDGEIRGMEAVWRRKDNSVIFVRENAKAIRDANDATLYYEGTVEDITERKRAEEALQSSEERYRTLYENNPLMVFTVDKEGTVLSVNQFGVEQLGYTVEELVGQSVLNVFYEDEKKAVLRHLTACLHDPTQVFRGEFRKVRKDGRVLWVKEVARAMQDTNSNTVVLIVCEDITEQIEIQKKLIQKEKLASLGEMAAGVAHEIRNPLGGIKMAAGLIRRDLGEKSFTTDMLNNILSGIKDIENIINDLLDFTRETKLEKEDYNIARMIKGVVNSLHREISEKGIQIVYNRFQGDIDLNVDGIKIRQVFINVLKNAIEAINHEEGKILINLYSHDSYVSIEFIDNGVGISKENLEKMYHPFFTTKPKGTGLGMTIVKRIVDLHKGDMDIKSVSGEGTKVKIILPVGGIFDEKKHSNS
jgi:PAS domain S-box-containing protein